MNDEMRGENKSSSLSPWEFSLSTNVWSLIAFVTEEHFYYYLLTIKVFNNCVQ